MNCFVGPLKHLLSVVGHCQALTHRIGLSGDLGLHCRELDVLGQIYGGYIHPASTLDNVHLIVSQWNTATGTPYHAMQFKTSVTPAGPVYTVGGAIGARYTQLGAETSSLGAPTGDEQTLSNGRVQDFEHGRIYWSAATGVWETYGLIAQKYLDLGGPTSPLGWPTSGELGTPNGIGRFNRFTEGNIYFNPQAGTHCVYGAIFTEYGRHGYEGGRFGFPITDEYSTPEGRRNDFQGGWIAWISATGQVVTS